LLRKGVLNEIVETLGRESRDGGESYVIPITLDDYMFTRARPEDADKHWAPPRPDVAQAVRDRVVADFRGVDTDEGIFKNALVSLMKALQKKAPRPY
jgi:hypothetical protein